MRAEKTQFFGRNFSKVLKNAIFALFFKILPAARKFWPKQCIYSGLGELRKSIWSSLLSVRIYWILIRTLYS